jgi:hypothetical protein
MAEERSQEKDRLEWRGGTITNESFWKKESNAKRTIITMWTTTRRRMLPRRFR